MNFRNLTHDDAGNDMTPRTREDWDEWVSATKLRGYLLKNTLGDWLELYGEANGFQRTTPARAMTSGWTFFASSQTRASRSKTR